MGFLKFILVTALMAGGVFFLLKGFGVAIPFVSYQGFEAHNVPAGLGIFAAGIALARFWKIETSRTETEILRPDGTREKTTTTVKSRFE